MKLNWRIGIAFGILLIAVPLFIYLVAIKDSMAGFLVFCYPVLICMMMFGAGLFISIKTGIWLSLGMFSLFFFFYITDELFYGLLKIPAPFGGILCIGISFYVAYIMFKKVLVRLLKLK